MSLSHVYECRNNGSYENDRDYNIKKIENDELLTYGQKLNADIDGDNDMAGGFGDDMYVYRPGSGADTIYNPGCGIDWILFTDDITPERLSYFKSGDNLLVKIDGRSDNMVTVQDWFKDWENQVAYIQPAGGDSIPASQVNTMVQDEPDAAPACGLLGETAPALGLDSGDADYNTF